MPTKAERKRIDGAVEAFKSHYASDSNWGQQRWSESLYPALKLPTRYGALYNRFGDTQSLDTAMDKVQILIQDLRELRLPALDDNSNSTADQKQRHSGRLVIKERLSSSDATTAESKSLPFPAPIAIPTQDLGSPVSVLLSHWNMDGASALCAHMLAVQPGDRVLDLCAAPGGKSFALALILFPHLYFDRKGSDTSATAASRTGCLHSNEADGSRCKRLAENLRSYLPKSLFDQGSVSVTKLDGSDVKSVSMLPLGPGGYDKVLVDAPCSSERHIIHAHLKASSAGRIAEEMARWRPGSSKTLAKTQLELLMTALAAVKTGGRVVYSTCSIETGENDGVVDKMLAQLEKLRKRTPFNWAVQVQTGTQGQEPGDDTGLDAWTERAKYGRIALPDHPGGGRWGPLYFSVLMKVPLSSP